MVRPDGPIPARIMLVGEAPGAQEEAEGIPFVGESGKELNRMLQEARITRSECFVTNVCRIRPPSNDINHFIAKAKKDVTPQHTQLRGRYVLKPVCDGIELLRKEIEMVKPKVIVALGGTPLWALTGLNGITRWRGSMLYTSDMGIPTKLIPTIHPAAVLREWSNRAIVVHDLKRAAEYRDGQPYPDPGWKFITTPNYSTVDDILSMLLRKLSSNPTYLSVDIETRAGHIDCIGVAWSAKEALCIPFMAGNDHYWNEEQETFIVMKLMFLMTHVNARCIFQNDLYDMQYIYRSWHYIPRIAQDTMLSWHTMFAGLPKKLDFQASMLCEFYRQWKPDRRKEKEGG